MNRLLRGIGTGLAIFSASVLVGIGFTVGKKMADENYDAIKEKSKEAASKVGQTFKKKEEAATEDPKAEEPKAAEEPKTEEQAA